MNPRLQFGRAEAGAVHAFRPAVFGLAFDADKLACVRVTRDHPYLDLPGGALDGDETEPEALAREFLEETGLIVEPVERLVEIGKYFHRSDGKPVNNVGGVWLVRATGLDPGAKVEADHELVWLDPGVALTALRHDAHAWAVAAWLRRGSSGAIRNDSMR